MRRSFLVLLSLGAVLAGCGGGSGGGGDESLTRYLPTDAPLAAIVDFDQARKEIGAPDDADVLDLQFDVGTNPESAAYRLATASSQVVPPMRQALTTLKTDDPLLAALDGTKIHAAASSQSGPPDGLVAAVKTDQSFDDLATALDGKGWTRDGDVLTDSESGTVKYVADAGDGVLLMTAAALKPQALIDNPPGGPAGLADFLDGADASERLYAPTRNTGCLKQFGGWQQADSKRGAFRFGVTGDADAGALDAGKLGGEIKVATPKADGAFLTAPFTLTSDSPVAQPLLQAIENFAAPAAYRC